MQVGMPLPNFLLFMTLGSLPTLYTRAILRQGSSQWKPPSRLAFMTSRPASSSGSLSPSPPQKRPRTTHVAVYGVPTLQDGNLRQCLADEVTRALQRAFGDVAVGADPMVTEATRPEFGDYQCNAALALAKKLKSKPRDAAEKLMQELQVSDWCEQPEIAGPGFINVKLKPSFVETRLKAMLADEQRLGVQKPIQPQRVIVDFSSPNIAKEMHVGHLRSTIIGDTISRILEFLGHDVLRLNHVGDWGTQFGMLITHLKEKHPQVLASEGSGQGVDLGDLVEFYKEAKVRFDEDDAFKAKSRQEVVNLQSGTEETLKAWKALCQVSRVAFQQIYDRLGVRLQERGESFYNPLLADVVKDLEATGLLVESEGARVVFLEGYQTREGQPQPFIVQKSDGGFLYATTDIAAARHRTKVEHADRVLYVTDAGQSSHFDQVFQVVRKADFVPPEVELKHVPFGLVQGEDGKKFKTRAGDTVKLKDLLDEAVKIAQEDLTKRYQEADSGETAEELERNARVIGIGAVKYADLSLNRESDYRFSYKKMLALTGNTAPYMLYAYARIQSILRKSLGEEAGATANLQDIRLVEPTELNLGRQLAKFTEQLLKLEKELYPHTLCDYIYDISQKFNQFYESCPVNTAESDEVRRSRLALCLLTARTLKLSLNLLGIEVLEKM